MAKGKFVREIKINFSRGRGGVGNSVVMCGIPLQSYFALHIFQ